MPYRLRTPLNDNLVIIWSLPPKGGTLNDQINPFTAFRRKINLPPLGGSQSCWAFAGRLQSVPGG